MAYVLIKRDLFEAPEHKGYTGIRDKAGVWRKDEIGDVSVMDSYQPSFQDSYALPVENAPDFTASCFPDLALDHLRKQVIELRTALHPFSEMAGELFAKNYQDYDIVASVKGKTDLGSRVKMELAFKSFRTARAAYSKTGGAA